MDCVLFPLQQIQQTRIPISFLPLLFVEEEGDLFLPIAPISHLVAGEWYTVLFFINQLFFQLDCLFGVVRFVLRDKRFLSKVIFVFLLQVIVVV